MNVLHAFLKRSELLQTWVWVLLQAERFWDQPEDVCAAKTQNHTDIRSLIKLQAALLQHSSELRSRSSETDVIPHSAGVQGIHTHHCSSQTEQAPEQLTADVFLHTLSSRRTKSANQLYFSFHNDSRSEVCPWETHTGHRLREELQK